MDSKHLFVIVIVLFTMIFFIFVFIMGNLTLMITDDPRSGTAYLFMITTAPVGILLMIVPPMKLFMIMEDRMIKKIHKRLGGDYTHSFTRTRLAFDDLELRTGWGDLVIEYIGLEIPWVSVRRKENKDWDVGPDVVESRSMWTTANM